MTGTSLKYLKTAHCMVSLYKSVSRKEMTPSGKGEELLKSICDSISTMQPSEQYEWQAGSISDDNGCARLRGRSCRGIDVVNVRCSGRQLSDS